jgi:phosphatidylglycerophosphate synthase
MPGWPRTERARAWRRSLRTAGAQLRLVPNQLTLVRAVLIPVLWACALTGECTWLGVGLALALFTDVADGFAARRLGQTSDFGSRFDSYVDSFFGPSAIVWLVLLRREVVTDHIGLAVAWVAVTYASLFLGLIRFRRFANLHLYSSKIAGLAQYVFLVDTFVSPGYHVAMLYAAAGLGILSSAETLVLQIVRPRVDEHMGSILLVFGRHPEPG